MHSHGAVHNWFIYPLVSSQPGLAGVSVSFQQKPTHKQEQADSQASRKAVCSLVWEGKLLLPWPTCSFSCSLRCVRMSVLSSLALAVFVVVAMALSHLSKGTSLSYCRRSAGKDRLVGLSNLTGSFSRHCPIFLTTGKIMLEDGITAKDCPIWRHFYSTWVSSDSEAYQLCIQPSFPKLC